MGVCVQHALLTLQQKLKVENSAQTTFRLTPAVFCAPQTNQPNLKAGFIDNKVIHKIFKILFARGADLALLL